MSPVKEIGHDDVDDMENNLYELKEINQNEEHK